MGKHILEYTILKAYDHNKQFLMLKFWNGK